MNRQKKSAPRAGALERMVVLFLLTALLCACTARSGVEQTLSQTADWLLRQTPEPDFGAVGGDWVVLGLARSDAQTPEGYFEDYLARVQARVEVCGGVIEEKKYTEYSRCVLALTAIGEDPTNVAGYDLLAPLGDLEKTVWQGVNGAIFALLALDCGDYAVPAAPDGATQATREDYVAEILKKECENGGWSLAGTKADADLTAMALQALAKYRGRPDVDEAVERALAVLSEMQQPDGGFVSGGEGSCESCAQVLLALCELGISAEDARFVKEGRTVTDALLDYRVQSGGFSHTRGGETNRMATEQAFYALVALKRAQAGQTTLYDMTDVRK